MTSTTLLILLTLLAAALALVVAIARTLLRVWLGHRVKMALLEKLERRPDLVPDMQELKNLLDGPLQEPESETRQNYILTGVFLAVIGLACALLANTFFDGLYATGFYFGGVLCVPIGFLMALLGVILKLLSRSSSPGSS